MRRPRACFYFRGSFPIIIIFVITGLNKHEDCSRLEDGLRCRQGVTNELTTLTHLLHPAICQCHVVWGLDHLYLNTPPPGYGILNLE